MEQVRVTVSAKLVKSQISIAFRSTLFATAGDTFIPFFSLDQILLADFFFKNLETFLEVKI